MHISFEYESKALRVINEIPSIPICHLEGQNGVGKSLAVRLLQVATGEQPFLSLPSAWVSLCRDLEWCRITVSGLKGASEIVFELRPEQWDEDPTAVSMDEIATVSIDGAPSTVTDARKLFRVARIAGDETLAESLAQDIDANRAEVASAAARLVDQVDVWERRLDKLARAGANISAPELADAAEALQIARSNATAAVRRRDASADRLHRLQRLLQLAEIEDRIRTELPEVEEDLARWTELARAAEREVTDADAEMHAFIAKRALSAQDKAAVEAALSLQRRRRRHLDRTESAVLAQSQWLGLEPDVDQETLEDTRARLQAQLTSARLRRSELDVIGPLLGLTSDMASALRTAVASGIGSQAVAELDRTIAAAELLTGIERRITSLEAQPRPGQLDDLEAEMRLARHEIAQLEDLSDAIKKRDRAVELVDEVDARLRDLSRVGNAASARQLDELRDRVERARSALIDAQVAVSSLQARRSSLLEQTLQEVNSERATILELIGGDVADLNAAIEAATVEASSADQALRDVDAAVVGHSARLEGLRQTLAALVYDLASTREYEWLGDTWPRVLGGAKDASQPDASDAPTFQELQLADAVRDLVALVESAAETFIGVRDVTTAVDDYLGGLAADVRHRGAGRSSVRDRHINLDAADDVRQYLEARYSASYSSPELLSTLFDDAEAVHLDLSRLWLSWTTSEGEERQQPLEAFSSGEQAFSYTLARLLIVGRRLAGTPNVLVALDEFGAFVARDRLSELLRFVQQRAADVATQVVVILPLAEDYAAMPILGDSSSHDSKVEQVRSRGYFAVPAELQ